MLANQAFIGLGSNIGNCKQILESALYALDRTPGIRIAKVSSFYRSKPLSGSGQPHYVNAVAQILTKLSADQLLDVLQAIENSHGRLRGPERWASRTLDLDLLLFNDGVIMTDRLTVPHPGIFLRCCSGVRHRVWK
jgi:2-amino-4-hydroxy-6-hydroxymethyldihydropteridine diphosphokinase